MESRAQKGHRTLDHPEGTLPGAPTTSPPHELHPVSPPTPSRRLPEAATQSKPIAQGQPTPQGAILGVDTGGTYTDLTLMLANGEVHTAKVASTPSDPGLALEAGMAQLAQICGEAVASCGIVHGTTVALNALLTGSLARAALVTNAGFQDLIEIGRGARPELYDLHPTRPQALIPRSHRFEIQQRSWPDESGQLVEIQKPTPAQVKRLKHALQRSKATSLALCLLHSYADPSIELKLADQLASLGVPITCSGTLLPAHREVERFSTACANAALTPIMFAYLERLGSILSPERLSILQNSGGTLPAEQAAREPVRVLFSGPAGGVVGAARAAQEAGLNDIVTLDMGGTSTDVAFHSTRAGLTNTVHDAEVGGHPIALPALDIHTIGCGGGSLVHVDAGGVLHVGPESAGAQPGPVCYGSGGQLTVTDACLHLGYIAAASFLDGGLELDSAAVDLAFEELARPMGVKSHEAASAVIDLAHAAMRRALGVMTMQRGQDPARLPLVAFGGGGGLHGAALAHSLQMSGALIPAHPGVLSALGMAGADAINDHERTVLEPLDSWSHSRRASAFKVLTHAGQVQLRSAGHRAKSIRFERSLALRYRGQSYDLNIEEGARAAERFEALHRQRYGWDLSGTEIELVTLSARAEAASPWNHSNNHTARPRRRPAPARAQLGRRRMWFKRWRQCTRWDRTKLSPGHWLSGPAVIEEYSATTLVPPGQTAEMRNGGHLWIK